MQAQDETGTLWAVSELSGTCLGDQRRTERLVKIAAALAEHPASSLPDALHSWSELKGAYRFFSNEEVVPSQILAGHRSSTLERVAQHQVVLAVQDTTSFNFTSHEATEGLGPLRRRVKDKGGNEHIPMGFQVHSCLAVSTDGVPLGLLGQQVWVRAESREKPKRMQAEPIETKESFRWLKMLEESTAGLPAGTHVVTVADREADITEFFLKAFALHQDILVRAARERRLNDPDSWLWAKMDEEPLAGTLSVTIPRGDDYPSRTAELELRYAKVTLRPWQRHMEPFAIHAVLARESNPPPNQDPIVWLLLTTLTISSLDEAITCVKWYTQRWKIERFHYTLKSGCRVEELQLESFERLHRALTVYSVVAWRLLHLTYAARVNPHEPCTCCLSSTEWKALYCRINRTRQLPQTPPDLQDVVAWLARLGGFIGRKSDGAPGVKVLWRGYRRLEDIVADWEAFGQGF